MGVFLNAYGPLRDGAWLKLSRAVALGAPAAAIGGALGLVAGEVVIGLLQGGLLGRALSWAVLGLGIGLGQGIADRSRDRLVYGLIGGGLGGFLGGFLFEWLRVGLGEPPRPGPGGGHRHPRRRAGAVPGPGRAGPPPGLGPGHERPAGGPDLPAVARRSAALGLDERAEVGLFGDPSVARRHAEIESTARRLRPARPRAARARPRVNGEAVAGTRTLRDGDRIELGRTLLVFRQR